MRFTLMSRVKPMYQTVCFNVKSGCEIPARGSLGLNPAGPAEAAEADTPSPPPRINSNPDQMPATTPADGLAGIREHAVISELAVEVQNHR